MSTFFDENGNPVTENPETNTPTFPEQPTRKVELSLKDKENNNYLEVDADGEIKVKVTEMPPIEISTGDVTISNEVEIKNDSNNPIPVSGNVNATVSGTVAVSNQPTSINVGNFPTTQQVSIADTVDVSIVGEPTVTISNDNLDVSVSNFPTVQDVNVLNTISVEVEPPENQDVTITNTSLDVNVLNPVTVVDVANFPTHQTVSVDNLPNTIHVTNFPSDVAVNNFPIIQDVNVVNQVGINNFPTTQNVNVENSNLNVTVSNPVNVVSVNNLPTNQSVTVSNSQPISVDVVNSPTEPLYIFGEVNASLQNAQVEIQNEMGNPIPTVITNIVPNPTNPMYVTGSIEASVNNEVVVKNGLNPLQVGGEVIVGGGTIGVQNQGFKIIGSNGTTQASVDGQGGLKVDGSGYQQPISGDVGILENKNTVKIDNNSNTVKLATSANTVKIDNTNNTVKITSNVGNGNIPVTIENIPFVESSLFLNGVGFVSEANKLPTNATIQGTPNVNIANTPNVNIPNPISVSNHPTSIQVSNFPSSVEISNDAGNAVPVSGTVNVGNFPSSQSVFVTNFPSSFEIANDQGNSISTIITNQPNVNVNNFPSSFEVANDVGNPVPVSINGTPTVTVSNPTSSVNVNNFPATQNVSVTNLPTVQSIKTEGTDKVEVTGLVTISNPQTNVNVNNFPTTQAVSLASVPTHPVTIDSTANTVKVTNSTGGASIPVTGTFWQTTQPVSGSVTATISGTPTVNISSGQNVGLTTTANTVKVTSSTGGASIPVTGTFWQTTQPVSLASVPTHSVTLTGTTNAVNATIVGTPTANAQSRLRLSGTTASWADERKSDIYKPQEWNNLANNTAMTAWTAGAGLRINVTRMILFTTTGGTYLVRFSNGTNTQDIAKINLFANQHIELDFGKDGILAPSGYTGGTLQVVNQTGNTSYMYVTSIGWEE